MTVRGAALADEITLLDVSGTSSAGEDVFGDPVPGDPDSVTARAMVTPLDATEDEINRDVRLTRYSVILEPDAPVDGLARVLWHGDAYEVIGEPRRFPGHLGDTHHLEIEIRSVKG